MGNYALYVTALVFVQLAGDIFPVDADAGFWGPHSRFGGGRSMSMLTSLPIMPPLMPASESMSTIEQGVSSVDVSAKAKCLRGGAAGAVLNRMYNRLLCLDSPASTSTASSTFRPLSEAFWEGFVPLLERELQEFARVDSNTPVLVSGGSCRCTAPNFLKSVTILRRVPATRSYLFDQLP